ncbi:unnamed protein product [Caenorhabditis brenneri]
MQPTFPLLRLPLDERLAVLQQTETIHLFVLSLISKRSKNLVTSANRKAKAVVVSVERRIKFLCQMFQDPGFDIELSIRKTPNEPNKVKKPEYVNILQNSPNDTLITCTKEEYEVKDWLDHLCQIFHRKDHRLYIELHGSRYDFDSVYEHFKNPSILKLHITRNTDYDNRVLKMIIPKRSLSLDMRVFENEQHPKHILIQNYDSFECFGDFEALRWASSLDDLLCANSRLVGTIVSGFSEKDINKFLKLWIHGSNPRLQQLVLMPSSFDYDVVLRGIQNFILREDQEKVFKTVIEPFEYIVKGGREIRRMDGTVGRIVINNEGESFDFFIWHE